MTIISSKKISVKIPRCTVWLSIISLEIYGEFIRSPFVDVTDGVSSKTKLFKFQVYCIDGEKDCKMDGN